MFNESGLHKTSIWTDYKRLFVLMWDMVKWFHRDRESFKCSAYYWQSSWQNRKHKIDDKFLTEEFLSGKPYGYEKTLELVYTDKGNLIGVKDVREED